MESNKDEAYRAKEFAEKKFHAQDLAGAKKLALKAQQMCPSVEGLAHLIAVLDVMMAAHSKINGVPDWYAVLQVDSTVEEVLVKKQYRKLALLLHPDKNKAPGAEEAFKVIGEASRVLSDCATRAAYDLARKSKQQPPKTRKSRPRKKDTANASNCNEAGVVPIFWTRCTCCVMHFQFSIEYMDRLIICPACKNSFMAVRIPYDPTARSTLHQGKENEKPPQIPKQSKGSQVPKKESEPKKEKNPQMPNPSKGSQVSKKESEPKNEKTPQMHNPSKGSQVPKKEGEHKNEKTPQMPNPSKSSQVPKKEGEPKKENTPQMPNQSKDCQVPNKGSEPKKGKSPQKPKESSGSNGTEKEDSKKDQKKAAQSTRVKSKKNDDKFDKSAFDRLFAGGMKKVPDDNPHQDKRPKIEV